MVLGVEQAFFGRRGGALAGEPVSVKQVHGARCVRVPFAGERPEADAMATDAPGFVLNIRTADCAPVLFVGTKSGGEPVIGAAHAGWRGALGGVLENTVAMMRELGAGDIRAAVGPCIAQESYEVSPGFEVPFLTRDAESARFFDGGRFDLAGYVRWRLETAGVAVEMQTADTYAREGEYFSHRRSVHRGEPDDGRQVAAIVIKKQHM